MSISLQKRDTMTDRVAGRLEKAILTGELQPLSRLKSVRELAKSFGVSHKTVSFALDRLEDQKLIVRKERSGVFVSATASAPEVTEAFVFIFGNDPEKGFARLVCDVATSRAAQGGFDFFTRYVTLPYAENDDDREYFTRRLDAEIAKLSKQLHPEAALIVGSRFTHDDVARCLELPFPVLFVGDFSDGDFPDLSYNRIGTTHDYFTAPLLWAGERGAKRVTLMLAIEPERGKYLEEALQLYRANAAKHGIDSRVIGVKAMHARNLEESHAAIDAAVAELKRSGGTDALILDQVFFRDYLMEALRREGFAPLTPALPLISTGTPDLASGWRFVHLNRSAVASFHARLCELMLAMKRGELANHREQFDMEPGREII